MGKKTVEDLADEVLQMDPATRFRLVADLLEARRPDLALSVARVAVTELGAAMLLMRKRKWGRRG